MLSLKQRYGGMVNKTEVASGAHIVVTSRRWFNFGDTSALGFMGLSFGVGDD